MRKIKGQSYFMHSQMTILAVICIVFCLSHVAYGNTCANFFAYRNSMFFGLLPVHTFGLTTAQKNKLDSHSGLQQLTRTYKQGEGISFEFASDVLEGLSPAVPGESIQTSFVVKILNHLFPKAEIRSNAQKKRSHKDRTVKLSVSDPNEAGILELGYSIPMPYLKISNSTTSVLKGKKSQYKKKFGLVGKKVVHLYYNAHEGIITDHLSQTIPQMIKEIQRAIPDVTVILSWNQTMESRFANYLGRELTGFDRIALLTDLQNNEAQKYQRMLILNDTKGLMPYLNVASDILIIKGPINLFEGLHVGTKTLIYNSEYTMQGYNRDAYLDLQDTAVSTGGAIAVDAIPRISIGIQELLKLPQDFTAPQNVKVGKVLTEEDVFLDVLSSILNEEFQQRN